MFVYLFIVEVHKNTVGYSDCVASNNKISLLERRIEGERENAWVRACTRARVGLAKTTPN
jgi:hypothetical protein